MIVSPIIVEAYKMPMENGIPAVLVVALLFLYAPMERGQYSTDIFNMYLSV